MQPVEKKKSSSFIQTVSDLADDTVVPEHQYPTINFRLVAVSKMSNLEHH